MSKADTKSNVHFETTEPTRADEALKAVMTGMEKFTASAAKQDPKNEVLKPITKVFEKFLELAKKEEIATEDEIEFEKVADKCCDKLKTLALAHHVSHGGVKRITRRKR